MAFNYVLVNLVIENAVDAIEYLRFGHPRIAAENEAFKNSPLATG